MMENSRVYVAWEPGSLRGIPALLSASSMVSGKQLISSVPGFLVCKMGIKTVHLS